MQNIVYTVTMVRTRGHSVVKYIEVPLRQLIINIKTKSNHLSTKISIVNLKIPV